MLLHQPFARHRSSKQTTQQPSILSPYSRGLCYLRQNGIPVTRRLRRPNARMVHGPRGRRWPAVPSPARPRGRTSDSRVRRAADPGGLSVLRVQRGRAAEQGRACAVQGLWGQDSVQEEDEAVGSFQFFVFTEGYELMKTPRMVQFECR